MLGIWGREFPKYCLEEVCLTDSVTSKSQQNNNQSMVNFSIFLIFKSLSLKYVFSISTFNSLRVDPICWRNLKNLRNYNTFSDCTELNYSLKIQKAYFVTTVKLIVKKIKTWKLYDKSYGIQF